MFTQIACIKIFSNIYMSVASSDNSDIDSVEVSINTKLLMQVNNRLVKIGDNLQI